MGFKCGIIGLPNVGKSTIFNALTESNIAVANFPFCTIKPNIGIVSVPDYRLDQLAKIIKPQRVLSAIIKFIDIAGLIKGASKGEGLGNQFLAKIREMDAIGHVIRCFDNDNIIHVNNEVSPLTDINIVNDELILADLDTCKRAIHHLQKEVKNNNEDKKNKLNVLTKCLIHLENFKMLRSLILNKEEINIINYLKFLTLKPVMYIANISENNIKNNYYLNLVTEFAKKDRSIVIPICAIVEADIAKINKKDERKEFMTELGIIEPSLNYMIRAGYKLLNLQTFFTVCVKEICAWTIQVGDKAPQAASKIHSDFKKGFIRAKVISFTDFIYYNGEQGAKEAGKIHIEGKDYTVQDGDIIKFLFNV